jgi:hypothetical protein
MKTKIVPLLTGLMLVVCSLKAQQGPPGGQQQRPSPEDRLKRVTTRLEKDLALKPEQKQKVQDAYKTFFEGMQKLGASTPPPPPPPMPRVKKEDMDKLVAVRDESMKKALTDEQFKKYQEIEKTMRPGRQRGPGGDPGGRRGPQGPPGGPPPGQ